MHESRKQDQILKCSFDVEVMSPLAPFVKTHHEHPQDVRYKTVWIKQA